MGAGALIATDTTAGYQGTPAPNQWFTTSLNASSASLGLTNATGLVVDALSYTNNASTGPWVIPSLVEGCPARARQHDHGGR
jgi:non-reducing end alpha-L-arabinofuranosidase